MVTEKQTDTVTESSETQPDIDMDAATAEISSELFGQGDEEGKVDLTEGEETDSSGDPNADAGVVPPQLTAEEQAAADAAKAAEGENSAAVQEIGAPKTWTKEALEKWATVDPRVQQEILKREEDFLNGITQYKAAADIGKAYDAVVEPYKPILQAENIDPVQMFQSFAANHYLLTRGTPQQKVELAAAMLQGYEIPLPELLNFMADNVSEPANPEVAALRKELGDLRNTISTAQRSNTDQVAVQVSNEIEAFASDPAHPYFDELADDISKLFGSGMASTLAEAYEKAVFANPNTRQKEIDRLTAEGRAAADAEAQKRKDKVAKSTADQVILSPKSRDGTVPVGSIDDTLNETMAAINARA